MHKKLSNWKAKRAGGRMTIYGTDESGNGTKIVGVDQIERVGEGRDARTIALINHRSPMETIILAD